MKTPFRLLASASAFAFTLVAAAQTAPTGAIEGRVFNAATGRALENARVTIEGTAREATTDESGSYRISGVPSGPARVSVAYVGMRTANVGLEVLPGASVQREFELFFAGAGTGPAKRDERPSGSTRSALWPIAR